MSVSKDLTWESNGVSEGLVNPLPSSNQVGAPGQMPQALAPQQPAEQEYRLPTLTQESAPQLSLAELLSQDTGIPVVPSSANIDYTDPFGLRQQTQPPQVPGQQQQQQTTIPQLTNLPGYQEFNSQFQAITGMSLQDTVAQLNTLASTVPKMQDMYQQFQEFSTKGVPSLVNGVREEARLRFDWGENFDRNMQAVRAAFQQLPPQMQEALNNLEGARLIWSRISQQQQQLQQPLRTQQPRPMNSPSNSGAVRGQQGQQQKVPMSQLMGLTPEQFYSPQVQAYLEAGLVDTNA
jgi:hypothetical protein